MTADALTLGDSSFGNPPASVEIAFSALASEANGCRLCPRMADCLAVLGPGNGSPRSRVLVVAEAPGRLGANRTGIPLSGDQSGRNFDELLTAAGLRRDDVFVTNAVLCNPRDKHGRNATPTTTEVRNCLPFLRRTIDLVDPELVIALGVVALKALACIAPHSVLLREAVATPVGWNDRLLVAMYHPSPRAELHRSRSRQREDFRTLRPVLSRLMPIAAPEGELSP